MPDPLRPTLPPWTAPLAVMLPEAPTVTSWAATVTEPPTPEVVFVVEPDVALAFTWPFTDAKVVAPIAMLPPWLAPVAATLPVVPTETLFAVTLTVPPEPVEVAVGEDVVGGVVVGVVVVVVLVDPAGRVVLVTCSVPVATPVEVALART